MGRGCSDYNKDSLQAVMEDAGLEVTPLKEWCVSWPSSRNLRSGLSQATLYLTLEPTAQRRGQAYPPMTQLIELSGVGRVVIGSPHPIPELSNKGASALHSAGIDVTMGSVELEGCQELIADYSERVNSKFQRAARRHSEHFERPIGFLHCSVIDSENVEAFANHGNAFGKEFDGKHLSFRDFGAYEVAPPPEVIWASSQDEEDFGEYEDEEIEDIFSLDFEDEEFQDSMGGTPMMPW